MTAPEVMGARSIDPQYREAVERELEAEGPAGPPEPEPIYGEREESSDSRYQLVEIERPDGEITEVGSSGGGARFVEIEDDRLVFIEGTRLSEHARSGWSPKIVVETKTGVAKTYSPKIAAGWLSEVCPDPSFANEFLRFEA